MVAGGVQRHTARVDVARRSFGLACHLRRNGLEWRQVSLKQEPTGFSVVGRIGALPEEPHHAEGVHAATWVWRGVVHNYCVRQRPGWASLRNLLTRVCGCCRCCTACHSARFRGLQLQRPLLHALLLQEVQESRLKCFVLSAGRPLYVQVSNGVGADVSARNALPEEWPKWADDWNLVAGGVASFGSGGSGHSSGRVWEKGACDVEALPECVVGALRVLEPGLPVPSVCRGSLSAAGEQHTA